MSFVRTNDKEPFLICPNDALNCMQFICLTRIWFVGKLIVDLEHTLLHTKDILYYSNILISSSFAIRHAQWWWRSLSSYSNFRSIWTEWNLLLCFKTDCVCVCFRALLYLSPKIKQIPASNVLAMNWAHPYNHQEKRSFNLFFILLFDLSANSHSFYGAMMARSSRKNKARKRENEKMRARKMWNQTRNRNDLLNFCLMKKRDIFYKLYNFSSPHELHSIAISTGMQNVLAHTQTPYKHHYLSNSF